MKDENLVHWLLDGDASIRYQVRRDLFGAGEKELGALQKRVEQEGWGASYLRLQNPDGHWGMGFYQPKWTSTHYTLLDLASLRVPRNNPQAQHSVSMVFDTSVSRDGSINFARSDIPSDVCINGMVLTYASYFGSKEPRHLNGIVDYLLRVRMADGGWNCEFHRGATHSSVHTTISVLEGLREFQAAGHTYRQEEIKTAHQEGVEFLLRHRLFMSERTGKVINKAFLMLSFPPRWHYDILRALDFFQAAGIPFDERMAPALDVLAKKRRADGRWPLQNKHPGQAHFDMEKTGEPSRWNTLRALRVMRKYRAS